MLNGEPYLAMMYRKAATAFAIGFHIPPATVANCANVDGSICISPDACSPNTATGFHARGLPPDSRDTSCSSAGSHDRGASTAAIAASSQEDTFPPSPGTAGTSRLN